MSTLSVLADTHTPDFNGCIATIRKMLQPVYSRPEKPTCLMVSIHNPQKLSSTEKEDLLSNCRHHNLSFYRFENPCKRAELFDFWKQLGLKELVYNPHSDDDGISQIKVNRHSQYIPYTNKPLRWHTDGYYNPGEKTIRAFAMHCIQPASSGGQNTYLNHEVVLAQLLKENPDYVTALTHPRAVTVLPNTTAENFYRSESISPVLVVEENHLLLRYSERTRSIVWRDDPLLAQARTRIAQILREDSPYHIGYKLNTNEGVVCNNVLHCRSPFQQDDQSTPRLLYRARFSNRIQ